MTFLPQFVLGTRGMPRRYARYLPEFQPLHQLSTIGALILGAGLALCAGVLIHSLVKGRRAAANPWGGASLEWTCSSPPPSHNFEMTPTAGDPYDYSTNRYSRRRGLREQRRRSRANAAQVSALDRRETKNVGPSSINETISMHESVTIGASHAGGEGHPHGHDPHLAHHFETPQQQFDAGKLGMWLFLVTEVLFFSGLFTAYAVYRSNHPEVFLDAHKYLDKVLGGFNTIVLLFSSLTMAWGVRCASWARSEAWCGA